MVAVLQELELMLKYVLAAAAVDGDACDHVRVNILYYGYSDSLQMRLLFLYPAGWPGRISLKEPYHQTICQTT